MRRYCQDVQYDHIVTCLQYGCRVAVSRRRWLRGPPLFGWFLYVHIYHKDTRTTKSVISEVILKHLGTKSSEPLSTRTDFGVFWHPWAAKKPQILLSVEAKSTGVIPYRDVRKCNFGVSLKYDGWKSRRAWILSHWWFTFASLASKSGECDINSIIDLPWPALVNLACTYLQIGASPETLWCGRIFVYLKIFRTERGV